MDEKRTFDTEYKQRYILVRVDDYDGNIEIVGVYGHYDLAEERILECANEENKYYLQRHELTIERDCDGMIEKAHVDDVFAVTFYLKREIIEIENYHGWGD